MRRFVPRAMLTAALAAGAAACAAGTATSGGSTAPAAATGSGEGGRFQVMIPAVEAQGGVSERDAERLAGRLRGLVDDMATHSVVNPELVDAAMRQYGVVALDTVTATQLAQQLGAQNVLYTILSPAASGLSADVRFVDVTSNDVIRIADVSAANANELATAIFTSVQSSIQGMSQAATCNQQLAASQYEEALATCNAAIAIVPTSSQALYGKATALLNLDRDEEALATFRQLLEVDETHQDALLSAGLAASGLGQSEEAQRFYNRYLELNPGNVQVRMTVASRIAEAGDYVSAYEVLGPAITAEENRNNPEFQRFLFGLATAAGGAASAAAREEGATEEAARAASRTYFEAALRAYQQAFASDSVQPDVNQIRQAIAVNTELGNTEEALRIAREATAQYDTVAAVWSQYASALDEAGQHQEAVQAFTRVIQLDPNYENVYIRRGMAYLGAGQQQQALADMQQAAQRGNATAVASVLFNEASRAMNDQRFGDAASLFELAAQHGDAQIKPQALFLQGFMLFRQGDAIARANAQGQAGPAREALQLFQAARPLVEAGENPSKAQVLQGIDQYIANQEAIIRAGGR